MPVRKHSVSTRGSFEELISDAVFGDLIEIGPLQSRDMDFRPCIGGVMELVPKDGFYLNGERAHIYKEQCRDWFPYLGRDVIIMTDTKLYHLEGGASKAVVVHENGPITEFVPHVFTETVIVREKKSPLHLLVKKHEAEIPAWTLRHPLQFSLKKLPWKKEFATRHVQPIDFPDPTPFHCGHPEGVVFFTEGKFVLVTDTDKKVIHEASRQRYTNWIACKQGIVDLSNSRSLCFNEDLSKPFYEGDYDEVIPTPSGCVVRQGHDFFMPYETKPFFFFPADEAITHPRGLFLRRDLDCHVLVLPP